MKRILNDPSLDLSNLGVGNSVENNHLTKNISTNSGVEYTLISSCSLKSSSLDQITEPRYRASAKYGTSLSCGANFSALDCISAGNLTIGNISILSLRISNASITSDSALPHISAIVPMFLLNSSMRYEDATNFNLSSKNKSCVLPLPIIAANKTVASTTSSIYLASRNLLATDLEILSVNSLAALSETLVLDENCLSFFNFSALSNIAFLATSDQSTLNSCTLFSNSSGISNFNSAILKSPNTESNNDYLKLSTELTELKDNKNIEETINKNNSVTKPLILNASVQPVKVSPGDVMLVSAIIKDNYGLKEVKVDMDGIEEIDLKCSEITQEKSEISENKPQLQEGKVDKNLFRKNVHEKGKVDNKNAVLLIEKASIMGTFRSRFWEELGLDLGLDSGKNFYSNFFEFLGFKACISKFDDAGSRLWEREKNE